MKKLDSDMQMLVYENYNKFISATDTIRKMAQNVEGMETEMADLKSSMDRISDSSATVNTALEGKRLSKLACVTLWCGTPTSRQQSSSCVRTAFVRRWEPRPGIIAPFFPRKVGERGPRGFSMAPK